MLPILSEIFKIYVLHFHPTAHSVSVCCSNSDPILMTVVGTFTFNDKCGIFIPKALNIFQNHYGKTYSTFFKRVDFHLVLS